MKWTIGVAATVLMVVAGGAAGEAVRCKATRDVWLSAMGKEKDYNMGAARTIKLKVWQEFGIVDFDVAALAGRKVTQAYLCIKPTGPAKFGLNGGSDLKWLSVSTVSHDWVEGKSTRYAHDAAGHGATFNESSYQRKSWGWQGARAYDVILGNGNTLRFDGPMAPSAGRLRLKLDPALVGALVAKATHGLLLMDGSTSVGVNSRIATREAGEGAYIEVTASVADRTPPAAPTDLKVSPAPNFATDELGAIRVSLTVPAGAFAYRVRVNGRPVARWQIPFAGPAGATQSFEIIDLAPSGPVRLSVAAVDAAGNVSADATAAGRTSSRLIVPKLPPYPFKPVGGPPRPLGQAKVWAFPEVTKVSPTTAKAIAEKAAADIRRKNAVWDGATGSVRLAAARGEIISFQIAVEGTAAGCKVAVSPLKAANGRGVIPASGVRLWRNWYVGEQSEYALPLTGKFDCPSADNGIAGQTLQAVTVDLHVPAATPAGQYRGTVTVTSGAHKAELALGVKVYDVTIPDEVHFNPELNCYGGPGRAGGARFRDSQVLAHYHRGQINRLPYNQGGRVHADWAPKVDAAGRVTDWSTFDNNLSGLLDGSLFKANPRSGVPIAVMYLPLFEGWPKSFRRHYTPGGGAPVSPKDKDLKLKHDMLAKPIEQAMDQAFKDAFVRCTQDFVGHLKAKGWNRTIFQFYLNNKPNYGYTMWTLDEPFEYLDWAALNFFGRLFKRAANDPETYTPAWHRRLFREGLAGMKRPRPTLVFRGDISRVMWQGSCSDGLMNAVYINSGGFGMPRLLRSSKRRIPTILNVYGSCNSPERSNWESAAWCLKGYASHCDGVLPWQSIGRRGALKKPDTNGLIIDAGDFGHAIASFRVHALRRGAQDCELLRLLQLRKGWSREHIGLLVSQKVPLTAAFRQRFTDEAAAVVFGTLTSRGFCELKEGVLQLLTGAR